MNKKVQPLAWLPNTAGYRFIGVTTSGERVPCVIRRNLDTGMHYVEGCDWYDLTGWIEK